MCQCVPVFVVFSGKALDVVFTVDNGTLFRSLILVSQHVGLQILEDLPTLWVCASAFSSRLFTAEGIFLAIK